MSIDDFFDTLITNTKSALAQMPASEDGNIVLSTAEVGVTVLALAFQLCVELGVSRDDLQRVVFRCMPPAPGPKIIQ